MAAISRTADVLHAKRRQQTAPAAAAFLAQFRTPEEKTAHFRRLAAKSHRGRLTVRAVEAAEAAALLRDDPETASERALRDAAWAALWSRLLDRHQDESEHDSDAPATTKPPA